MAKRSVFSQFAGAFVRQMGRETAHDMYGDFTGKNTQSKIVGAESAKLRVPGFWKYIGICIANVFPFVSFLTLIKGIKRLFSGKITYHFYTIENVYKTDRRYSSGARIIGQQKVEQKFAKPKNECDSEDIKRFRIHALIYILIACCAIGLKYYGFEKFREYNIAETARTKEIRQQATQWNTYQIKDEFTGKVRKFQYVCPTLNDEPYVDLVLIKENGYYLYSSMYISSFDTLDFKFYTKQKSSIISRQLDTESLYDKDRFTIKIDKANTYSERIPLKGTISKNLATADSLHIRLNNKIYKFNLK